MQSNMNTEAFNSMNHKLHQLRKIETRRYIYRVHEQLRDVNNSAYEPKLIAIGPYHHGKDNLKMMEEHKLRYLQLLLESQKQNVERYVSAIGELEQKARHCYAEPIGLNGAQFVEMMVLDGCFIIELARKFCHGDSMRENDPIFQTKWMIGYLRRDLILFENQIPFFVLCKLFDLIEGENKHDVLIDFLSVFCNWSLGNLPSVSRMSSRWSSEEIKHLLHLVYCRWVPSSDDINFSIERDGPSLPLNGESNFIPSAAKLKAANVKFCKKKGGTVFEVKFENGIMEMPPFIFDDGTECLLRNFVAYEQYFLKNQHNIVTDYVTFLDLLIDSSKDVEILSECGIINNWLGDSEAVAKIINRLGDWVFCGSHFVYAKMFDDVNGHYKNCWNRWMATLRRDIFFSPWAYLSFFAALTALVLTIVQTVCSVLERV